MLENLGILVPFQIDRACLEEACQREGQKSEAFSVRQENTLPKQQLALYDSLM